MKHQFSEFGMTTLAAVVLVMLILLSGTIETQIRNSVLETVDKYDKKTNDYVSAYKHSLVDAYNNDNMCRAMSKPDWSLLVDRVEQYNALPVKENDFIPAVPDSEISAGVWNYPKDFEGGAIHLGIDYAAPRNSEIYAPANSIVIIAEKGHGDGYLGNLDGGETGGLCGGGNQVYLMSEVNNKVYAFIIFHMSDVRVNYGDVVEQGTIIGTVGSSGSSTGAHAHVEMYYLGEGTIDEYLQKDYNSTFGVGRGELALKHKCEDEHYANSGACILNPREYLEEENEG